VSAGETPASDPGKPTVHIGQSIRTLRTGTKLSLREVARRAGVTASLLSQIETGRVSPSVGTLFRLSEALEIPVARFFTPVDGPDVAAQPVAEDMQGRTDRLIVRGKDRATISLDSGIEWRSLTGIEQPGIRFVDIAYPPGGRSAKVMLRHGGRDFLVVVEGQMVVQLEFTTHVLEKDDSLWFDASIPHQLRNESDAPARVISITVDPWPLAGD
jgi:transcriptional regulator with XRE-family HTH domain